MNIGDLTVLIGCENSLFTIDTLQTIKDLSISETIETDDLGNTTTNLVINTEVASHLQELLTPISSSGDGLFSVLSDYRREADNEYEAAIANIRIQSVIFSLDSTHIASPLNSGTVLSFTEVNATDSDLFTQQLEALNQAKLDLHERIQLFFSYQNPTREPYPMWSEVPPRPTGV